MTMLILGLVLWIGVHLFPSVLPGARESLMAKLGEGPYKGLFALDLVIAILLMVFGWRSTMPEYWYTPPWGSRDQTAHAPVVGARCATVACDPR